MTQPLIPSLTTGPANLNERDSHSGAGKVLELFVLVVADVVEFEELVCLCDDSFCMGSDLVDSAEAFCGFFVHDGGSFRWLVG